MREEPVDAVTSPEHSDAKLTPGERLITAVSSEDREFTFAEMAAKIRAALTPEQKRDLSMDAEVGYEEGLAMRANFAVFGDLAAQRESYARDPDLGYPVPKMKEKWERKSAPVKPEPVAAQTIPAPDVAAREDSGEPAAPPVRHPRHKSSHAQIVEPLAVYEGGYQAPLRRRIAIITVP